MKKKYRRSKPTTYISYTSLRTQVLKRSIVFGLLLVFNVATAQDSVKCFNLDEQKRILEKFVLLERCQDLRATDSAFIDVLSNENNNLIKDLAKWEKKAARRKKLIFVSGAGGLIIGIFATAYLKR
jgi:histone deacetylase complex regulatory component SIN3